LAIAMHQRAASMSKVSQKLALFTRGDAIVSGFSPRRQQAVYQLSRQGIERHFVDFQPALEVVRRTSPHLGVIEWLRVTIGLGVLEIGVVHGVASTRERGKSVTAPGDV
jgi:hypothetical protein